MSHLLGPGCTSIVCSSSPEAQLAQTRQGMHPLHNDNAHRRLVRRHLQHLQLRNCQVTAAAAAAIAATKAEKAAAGATAAAAAAAAVGEEPAAELVDVQALPGLVQDLLQGCRLQRCSRGMVVECWIDGHSWVRR